MTVRELRKDTSPSAQSHPAKVPRRVDGRNLSTPRAQKKAMIKTLLDIPVLRWLIDRGKPIPGYKKLLNRCLPSWIKNRGVYSSFAEARADAPKNVRQGYDHDEIANAYQGQGDSFLYGDYPAMYWMSEALRKGTRVFDLGGSVGVSFYSWQRHVDYSPETQWTVCELPAVARAGEKLAAERGEDRLHFTSTFEEANGHEFLLMSGCLQYIETPIGELLGKLTDLPPNLIINRIPLHNSKECVTLQNVRWMVAPYRVFRRDAFIAEIEAHGYRLRDSWFDLEHTCWIPFYPEYSVEAYAGMYFERDGVA